jgi:hypothetical protein
MASTGSNSAYMVKPAGGATVMPYSSGWAVMKSTNWELESRVSSAGVLKAGR